MLSCKKDVFNQWVTSITRHKQDSNRLCIAKKLELHEFHFLKLHPFLYNSYNLLFNTLVALMQQGGILQESGNQPNMPKRSTLTKGRVRSEPYYNSVS